MNNGSDIQDNTSLRVPVSENVHATRLRCGENEQESQTLIQVSEDDTG